MLAPGLRRGRLRRQAAARDDDMGVRMVGQCRSPGVQYRCEPDAGAEVLGVVGLQPTGLSRGGDRDQGLGGNKS